MNIKFLWCWCIFSLLSITSAFSTSQESEILFIDGVKWDMLAQPIDIDSIHNTKFREFLPKERHWTTANWDGYTGAWEIKNNQLYLQKVIIEISENHSTEKREVKGIDSFFSEYKTDDGIFASWFSGKVRLGRGDIIRFGAGGFDRNYMEECVLTIKDGVVTDKVFYHNSRKEGIKLLQIRDSLQAHFPWEKFPEISGKRHIIFLSDFDLSADGHYIDSNVKIRLDKVMTEDQSHPIITAIKKKLKEIYPWEVLYINGKYRPEYQHFTFPIIIKSSNDETPD